MKTFSHNHLNSPKKWIYLLRKAIPAFLIVLLFSGGVYGQTTWYSYQSGNWETASTWTTDPSGTLFINPTTLTPVGTDFVVLLNGRTVIKTTSPGAATALCSTLDVKQGAVMDFRNTINHTIVTVNGQGIIKTQGTLPAVTNFNFNNAGGGTIEYNNTANFNFSVFTFNNLTLNFSGAGIVGTLLGNLTVNNDLTITQGVFQINDGTDAAPRTVTTNRDVVVSSGGIIRLGTGNANHTFSVKGDFTINGSVDFYELAAADYTGVNYNGSAHADVVFNNDFADQNLICNGPSEFYRIGIYKGNDWTYSLAIDASNSSNFILFGRNNNAHTNDGDDNLKALGLTRGTLKLGPNIVVPCLTSPPASTNNYDINSVAQLVLDGASVASANVPSDMAVVIYGKLLINSGTFDATNTRASVITRRTSNLTINGGTLTATQLRTSNEPGTHRGAFIMNGGTLNLLTNTASLSWADNSRRHATLSFTYPDNVFKMSGGVINIMGSTPEIDDGGGTSGFDYSMVLGSNPANISVTGGTINLTVPTIRSAYITSTVPLWNLNVIGTNGTFSFGIRDFNASSGTPTSVTAKPLIVYNDFVLQNNAVFDNTINTQPVTVGGNFTISAGTTYNPGNNITKFNGTGGQVFTNAGTIGSGGLNDLTIANTSSTSLSQNLTVRNNLTIDSGCFLQDMGRTINVGGNISNSGTHASQASGSVVITGAGVQTIGGDGNGVFGNLSVNKTGGSVTLSTDQSLTGNLRLANNGLLNIGVFNLSLGASSSVYDALAGTGQAFSNTKMIVTTGNQSDGGVTKAFSSTAAFLYPIGTGADYTPAQIQVNQAPTAWGTITIKPAAMRHLLLQGSNNAITYFWHTTENGFSGIIANSVTHRYYYSTADVVGIEANYLPGRYDNGGWTTGTTFEVNETTNEILFNNSSYVDGDYTCGEASAFTGPTVFYSRNAAPNILTSGADWNLTTTWSTDQVLKWNGAEAAALPSANNVVMIGDGTVAHIVNTTVAATSGNLLIQQNSTLDLSNITGHNFGAFPESKVTGSGTLKIASTTFPQGDWGTFLGENGGYVEYYSNATVGVTPLLIPGQYLLPSGATANIFSYRDLTISPGPNKVIYLPNNDLTIYENLTISNTGTPNPVVQINPGANTTTLIVNGDLAIRQNSTLRYSNLRIQNVVVEGNILIENNAVFDVATGGAAYNNTLTVGGNMVNNGTLDMLPAANRYCDIIFKGSNNTQLSGTTAARTRLNAVTIDKGISRDPVLDVTVNNTNFSLNTTLANALTLTNGTFRLSNGAIINLSTGLYSIPSSGCISVNNGTINIATANAGANDLSLNGRIEVLGTGIMNIGTLANAIDNDIEYSSGGTPEIFVSGGTLNVNGQVRRGITINTGSLNYNQSGGIVNIYGEIPNNARGIFEVLNPGSNFTMTGGTLNIINNFNNAAYNDLYLAPAAYTVNGGTVQFGLSGTTTDGSQFNMVSSSPLGNLVVNGVTTTCDLTVNQHVFPLTLLGNLTINGGNSVFSTNGLDVNIGGNLINNNTNAGTTLTVGGYQAASANQVTAFNGAGAQQITGTGTNITNFANLTMNTGGTLSLTGTTSDIRVNGNLSLNSGTLADNSNDITVIQHIINNAVHTSTAVTGGIILAGTTKQVVSGNGSGVFGTVNLNNGNGADIIDNCRINGRLTFTNGVLYIDDYLLTLGENFSIAGNGAARYIRLNGALSDQGVKKLFNPGASSFTFPIGVSGKYTPVSYNITANTALSTSYITLKPINSKHPATSENPAAVNELQYYWNAVSSGFSGLNVTHTYQYINADALPDETNYVVGQYDKPTYSWIVPPSGAVNAGADNFTITNVNYIDGEYTCGVNIAPSPNFQNLPVYYSRNATLGGNWNNAASWTLNGDGTDNPVPSYPQGNPTVILPGHTITMNIDNAQAYSVLISGTFDLAVTRYHNLGHISGAGLMRIAANTAPNDIYLFPGGYYDAFMTTSGSTVEFYGNNPGSLPLKPGNVYKPYQNVIFSGNSLKRMSSENMKVLNDLTIRNGSILTNTLYNKDIFLLGDWNNENNAAGGFLAGLGLVSFEGTSAQNLNIVNNIIETFYNLRINNAAGVYIAPGAGDVEAGKYLYLTAGNITTSAANSLTLNNTSTSAAIGGGASSFINGPLRKKILNSSSFNFPVGKSAPRNRFGNVVVMNTNTSGTQTWTAEYFDANPHPVYDTSMRVDPISQVSGSEYWNLAGPAGGHANVRLRWDNLSELVLSTPASRQKLRVAEFLPAGWTSVGQTVTDGGVNSGTIETTTPVALDNHVFTIGISSVPTVRITSGTTVSICNDGSQATIDLVFTDAINAPFDFAYTINGGLPQYVYNVGSPFSLIFDGLTLGGAGSYAVTITDVWDNTGAEGVVRAPSQVNITVLPTPANDITGPISVGTNTTTSYATTAASTDFYSWSLNNGLGTVNNNTTRTPSVDWGGASGLSRLTVLKTNSNGCSASGYVDVTISLSPQPDITGPAAVCAGSTQTYSVTPNAGHTFSWTVSPGGTIQGSSTGSSVSILWGSASTGETVSVTESDGVFSGSDNLTVDIGFVPQSIRTVNVNPASVCDGGSSTITVQNSENNVAYQLRNDFDDSPVGSYIGGTGGPIDFVVSPAATTTYNILAYTSAPFGCQVELNGTTYTVTVNAIPAVPTASTTIQPTCAVPTGTIVVTAPLGAAYEYNIDGGTYQAGTSFAGLLPGNHTLTTRLAASPTCISASTANIVVNAVPTVPAVPTASTTTQPTCAVPTGTITVTAPLGAAYEYNIDGGTYQAGTSFALLLPGNHTLTTRLAASPTCISASTGNIVVNAVPTVPAVPTASTTIQPTCAVPTGTIVVTAPLGAAYEYNIDGGTYQAGTSFALLLPGNHTLTTRLAASPTCISASTGNIVVNAVPTVPAVPTASTTTQPTCAVPTGTITVTSPLGAAYEYNVDGGTYQSGTSFALLLPGNHTLTTRLAASPTCISASTGNIVVNAVPTVPAVPTASTTIQPTCAVPTGTIVVTAPLGAAYEYNIDGGTYQAGTSFALLLPGNHTLTTRLAASPTCISASTGNIVVNAVPTVPAVPTASTTTQPTCAVPTGTIVVTAPLGAAYEYNIDGGTYQAGTSFALLLPGNHTLTTRLAASPTCISASTGNIVVNAVPTVPAVPTASTTTQPTCAVPTGTIVVTAPLGAAYEYNVDGGTYQAGTSFAGLLPGNHTLTTRLAASPTCISASTANIVVNAVPTVPAVPTASTTTQPTCAVPTGTITVTAPLGAAYEYNIDGGTYQAGTSFAGLLPGNHTLTTRLAASPTCISASTGNIVVNAVPTVPAVPTASTTTQPTCAVPTGTITVTAPLGAAYEYNIDGGTYQAGTSFALLLPGNHTLTTRLAASPTCISASTGNIVVNAVPTVPAVPTASTTTQPTCAVPTGTIVVTAPLGAAYEYNIDGGTYQAGTSFAGLLPGNHTLTTRLAASPTCISASTANIVVNALPTVPAVPTASTTIQPTCAVPTGTIVVTAPLGAAYEYNIDGGTYQAGTSFAGLLPGNHTLTTRLAASPTCISASTGNIVVNAVPTVPAVPTASTTTQPTCAVPTGTIVVTAPLGAAYEYNIDGGTYQAGTSFAGLLPGNHTLTTRLAASPTCISASTANIVVNAVPTVPTVPTVSLTQPTCATATGTITVTAPTGAGMTYSIDGADYTNTTGVFLAVASGMYTVTAQSSTTCISSGTNVTINAQPVTPAAPTIGSIVQPTCAVTTGSVVLSGLPALGTWTITESLTATTITGTGTTGTFSGLAADTYSFTVTNALGCTSASSANAVIVEILGCNLIADFSANDTEVCAGDEVIFTDASQGIIASTVYQWIFGDGAVPDTIYGAGPHHVTYSTSGLKTVQLIVSNGVGDTLVRADYITVHEIPVVSVETVNRCGTGSVLFTATPVNANRVDFSSDAGLNVIHTDNSSPYNYSAEITESSSLNIWARAYNTVDGCAGTWDSSAFARAYRAPVPEKITSADHGTFSSGYVDIVCFGKENSLYYVNGDPLATYNWHVTGSGMDITAIDTSELEIDWNVTGGDYLIEFEKVSSDGCSAIRDTLVMVSQPVADLGSDVSICEGESHTFELTTDFTSYLWFDASTNPTYTATVTGEVSVRVRDAYNCSAVDTALLTVNINPTVYLGEDTILCADNATLLDAGDFVAYNWSTDEITRTITVRAGAGTVSVTVTDDHDCQASDEIVILECDPETMLGIIPNTYTPNGDNAHDSWTIEQIYLFPDANIQVYDRWGRIVFKSDGGYNNDWYGTGPNGQDLPVDTYYYIIDLKVTGSEPITGTVSIIR